MAAFYRGRGARFGSRKKKETPPYQIVYNQMKLPKYGRPVDPEEILEPLRLKDVLVVVSIDPGKKNVGFRIERRHLNPFNSSEVVHVETLVWERLTTSYSPAGGDKVVHMYADLSRLFERHLEDIPTCDLVIVEHQLTLARREIIQIQQHMTTYFMIRYPKAIIIDLDSHLKGRQLGYKQPADLKKWSIVLGTEIIEARADKKGMRKLSSFRSKQDDLTDTLLQIEAFCRFVDLAADRDSF